MLFFLFFILQLFTSQNADAHAFDNTLTSIFYNSDYRGNHLSKNELYGVFSSNWIQFSAIIEGAKSNVVLDETTLLQKSEVIEDFIKNNITIKGNDRICTIKFNDLFVVNPELVELSPIDVDFKITCDDEIDEFSILNLAFLLASPLQSNNLDILNGNGLEVKASDSFSNQNKSPVAFSISKESEIESKLNISNQPYTSASQSIYKYFTDQMIIIFKDKLVNFTFDNIYFVVGISLLVGLFHALESGHGKLILASVIINNKLDFKRSTLFAAIFTLSHMSDIFIFAILLYFIDFQFPQLITSQIRFYALIIFITVSLYLFIKSIYNILRAQKLNEHAHLYEQFTHHHSHHTHDHHHHDDHEHGDHTHPELEIGKKSMKEHLILAFTTGLAPCLTGWLILTTIFTTGRFWIILPVLISFSLGIFVVEVLFAIAVSYFRVKVEGILENLNNMISLLSGSLLLSVGIFALVQSYFVFIIPSTILLVIIYKLIFKRK